MRTALDALAKGQGLPRIAYTDKDKGTPPGDSLLKRLTAWRAEESWQAVPLGIQRAAVGEAANAVERWNDTRETHALDIVQAAERAEKWPGILQQWKDTIAVWNAKGRKGKKPEHPGRCKGIPRRAVRANPDEQRLFKQRKKREREATHHFACAGEKLRVREETPTRDRPEETPGQWVNIALPDETIIAHNVYLAPEEHIAKVEVRERAPRRKRTTRRGTTQGTPHVPVENRTPSQRAYRCVVTIGRIAPRLRNPAGRWAGADPGVIHPAALAVDGEDTPRFIDLPEERIAQWQKNIETEVATRRHLKRGSQNWNTSWDRQKTLDTKIRNVCDDAVVQALACILDEIDALALEDTQWENLIKSARGTSLDPGRNVNAKRALNRRIAAVAPGRLRLKLTSMCAHKGVWLVLTEPAKSSTTCNKCGKSDPKNRKTQAEFRCTRCNHTDNADANAAKNHRERGRNTMWKRLHSANQRHNERMTTGGARVSPPSTTEKSGAGARTCGDKSHEPTCRDGRGQTPDPSSRTSVRPGRNATDGRTRIALERSV